MSSDRPDQSAALDDVGLAASFQPLRLIRLPSRRLISAIPDVIESRAFAFIGPLVAAAPEFATA
jgi:hypothetical protein